MPGIATGEAFSFAEGKLYLYASASGTTSGSGIGFAENATLEFLYGWLDYQDVSGNYDRHLTGRRATLTIGTLYADKALFALANASAAVNAKFEGVVTGGAALGKSAQYVLYSGAVDSVTLTQPAGDLWRGSYAMHANLWSGFGQ